MSQILVLGAGGHGQVIADILHADRSTGCAGQILGYLDDNPALWGRMFLGRPVLGALANLHTIAHDAILLGIGDNRTRQELQERLEPNGECFATAIHPSVVVGSETQIGSGVVVCAGVVVGTRTCLERGAILNTGCSVDHHNHIGAYAHVGPGAHLGGDVHIGKGALIGIGAVVMPQRAIGKWAIVGAGAVVTTDVPDYAVVVGTPAKIIKWHERAPGFVEPSKVHS